MTLLSRDAVRVITRQNAERLQAEMQQRHGEMITGLCRFYETSYPQEEEEEVRRSTDRQAFLNSCHRLADQLREEERRERYHRLVEDSDPLDSSSRHTWPQLGPIGGPVLRSR